MTESEWLACAESPIMLDFLCRGRGVASAHPWLFLGWKRACRERRKGRKLRLFGCACCRRVWRLLEDPRSREAVERAEEIEGPTPEERHAIAAPAWVAYMGLTDGRHKFAAFAAAVVPLGLADPDAIDGEDALGEQASLGVGDEVGVAWVGQGVVQGVEESEASVGFPQEQDSGVGGEDAAGEVGQ